MTDYRAVSAQYQAMRLRAERIRRLICDRAKKAFDAAFGGSTSYECFHLAHNWQDLPSLTPAQRRACRFVLYLEKRQWAASRIVDAWYKRVTQ